MQNNTNRTSVLQMKLRNVIINKRKYQHHTMSPLNTKYIENTLKMIGTEKDGGKLRGKINRAIHMI